MAPGSFFSSDSDDAVELHGVDGGGGDPREDRKFGVASNRWCRTLCIPNPKERLTDEDLLIIQSADVILQVCIQDNIV